MTQEPDRTGHPYIAYCHHCEKKGYSGRKAARKAARVNHPDDLQHAYECPVGTLWHYGHSSPPPEPLAPWPGLPPRACAAIYAVHLAALRYADG